MGQKEEVLIRRLDLAEFPNLQSSGFAVTSVADQRYNCLAWAAKDSTHWWEPQQSNAYWPNTVPNVLSVDSLAAAYVSVGFGHCADAEFEQGFEKIAIYAAPDGVTPLHAARQLGAQEWTSKFGAYEDIRHAALADVAGTFYGTPVRFLRRAIP